MLSLINKACANLRHSFWGTLYSWQNHRPLWLLGGLMALVLDLIAIYYFQGYLDLSPCEKCVYIRLSMLVICFAMLLTFIYPKSRVLKCIALILTAWAIVQGMLWSVELNTIIKEVEKTGFSACSMSAVYFPFGLPLDEWFPSIFMPMGLCGEDHWRFLGFNMAEYMILIYGVYAVLWVLFFISIIVNKLSNNSKLH